MEFLPASSSFNATQLSTESPPLSPGDKRKMVRNMLQKARTLRSQQASPSSMANIESPPAGGTSSQPQSPLLSPPVFDVPMVRSNPKVKMFISQAA